MNAAGIEQLRRAGLADDARQDRAGAHVAAGEADAVEQEGDLGAGAQTHVGGHRHDRAGAGADAFHGGDDRLRAGAHRLDQIAGHAREGGEILGLHRDQRADDLEDVAARREIAAGTGDDDALTSSSIAQARKKSVSSR
jgi:hypothetical protein